MRLSLLSPLALILAAAPLAAQSVVIDFNFYPGPDGVLGTADDVPITAPTTFASQAVQLTDQFATLGIDFTPNPALNGKNEILDSASFTTPAGHTPPNLLASEGSLSIEAAFSHPVFSVSALIGISGGSDEMEIFDAAGNSLGLQVGDDVVVTLTSTTEIARFEIRPFGSTTPAIDNLQFDAPPSGPSLAVGAGAPGGSMTFDLGGFTPNGSIALVYGPAGTYTVPGGGCAGLVVDLLPINFPPLTALILVGADANGDAQYTRQVPGAGTGLSVQAVDISGCEASNAIVL